MNLKELLDRNKKLRNSCNKLERALFKQGYEYFKNKIDIMKNVTNNKDFINQLDFDTLKRFIDKVNIVNSGCWEWFGSRHTKTGHGVFQIGSKESIKAYRLSYAIFNGPIEKGLMVRHLCNNPPCINPLHLELGTHKDNHNDMVKAGRNPNPKNYKYNPLAGADNPNAKLTIAQVIEIRNLHEQGFKIKELVERYGLPKGTIGNVVNRNTWRNV